MARTHTDLSIVPISVAPSPATTGTSLGVTDANAAFLPDLFPFWGLFKPTGASPTRVNAEIVRVTAKSSSAGVTTFTIVRAQGVPVTTARTVIVGDDFYETNGVDSTLQQAENLANKTFTSPLFQGSIDGWTLANETWTFATASTFTISGVDRTLIYQKGTLLKFTQTTVKYGVVVASSFSTNTTVTIAVNTDFTIADAAITSPLYSYQANPQGFPAFFNFAPTFTGFSTNPSGGSTRFSVHGRIVRISRRTGTNGTSNSVGFTMSVPITAIATTPDHDVGGMAFVRNNSVALASPGRIFIEAGTASLIIEKSYIDASFTTSGTKDAEFNNFTYGF